MAQVDELVLAGFEEHVPGDREADIDDHLEVLVGLELLQDIILGV